LIAITRNANQVYVLRVFLGLCESSAWPGMMTLFSKSRDARAFPTGRVWDCWLI
jgi:hypothetical protein